MKRVYRPLTAFHICAGTIALLSGFVAMSLRKGCRRHGVAGDVFVISMLGLSASGAIVGIIKFHLTNSQAQLANFFVGTLTFYLVGTAWWAARRRDGKTGIFDWAGLLVALSVGAALVISGLEVVYGKSGLKNDLPVTSRNSRRRSDQVTVLLKTLASVFIRDLDTTRRTNEFCILAEFKSGRQFRVPNS